MEHFIVEYKIVWLFFVIYALSFNVYMHAKYGLRLHGEKNLKNMNFLSRVVGGLCVVLFTTACVICMTGLV